MKAVGYIRRRSSEDLARDREQCTAELTATAKAHGFEIVEWVYEMSEIDVINRTGLKAVLHGLDQGDFQAIIVGSIDEISAIEGNQEMFLYAVERLFKGSVLVGSSHAMTSPTLTAGQMPVLEGRSPTTAAHARIGGFNAP